MTLKKIPLYITVAFLLLVMVIICLKIVHANNGVFTYTLDDPYIHLTLSHNIAQGHYGLNASETSAPSSSIIWPFLLALSSGWLYLPLILNVLFSTGTVYVLWSIIATIWPGPVEDSKQLALFTGGAILLVISLNLIPMIFTGMEHSLQILIVTAIAYGLILENKTGVVPFWLTILLISAVAVRYDTGAVVVAALIYLLSRKHYGVFLKVVGGNILINGCFFLFLSGKGLSLLPSSVLVKSSVVSGTSLFQALRGHLKFSFYFHKGAIFLMAMLSLLAYSFFSKGAADKKYLAASVMVGILLHLLAGGYNGGYCRYETYIWAFLLLMILYIFSESMSVSGDVCGSWLKTVQIVLFVSCFVLCTNPAAVSGLFTIHVAANNIYEQQYQMHRFAADYIQGPVAVNDIGYVAYENPNYVLDLWGLASKGALKFRRTQSGSKWIRQLVKKHTVKVAMIYKGRFPQIPEEWIELGELRLSKPLITPAESSVTFYVTEKKYLSGIKPLLAAYVDSLPSKSLFIVSH